MIKFYSAKADRPHPADLVGKLVGKEGVMKFRGYSLPYLVTGASGKRLYAKVCERGNGDVILPTGEWIEDSHFNLSQVAYVCDTIEEAELIRAAGRKSMQTYQRVQNELKAQINAFFTEIASPDSVFEEAAEDDVGDDGFFDSQTSKPQA
jgi:hypothetical protein